MTGRKGRMLPLRRFCLLIRLCLQHNRIVTSAMTARTRPTTGPTIFPTSDFPLVVVAADSEAGVGVRVGRTVGMTVVVRVEVAVVEESSRADVAGEASVVWVDVESGVMSGLGGVEPPLLAFKADLQVEDQQKLL